MHYDEFHDTNEKMHDVYSNIGHAALPVSDGRLKLPDEDIRDNAIEMLEKFKRGKYKKENFYMTVGFTKPHIPWAAPKRFFDLYTKDDIPQPPNKAAPEGCPPVTWPSSTNCILKNVPKEEQNRIEGTTNLTVPDDLAASYQQGYYACISFVDSLIGDVLDKLESLDLDKNTVILLHGDHGYQLGENSAWCKRTQFETANHVPLIFRYPGQY
jgi:iduronate 2-sulfatase